MSELAVGVSDELLIADAIAAREEAEAAEEEASPSRWREADSYAELSRRGWTQQRIADACGTTQPSVSKFIACARNYSVLNSRSSFWTAFADVNSEREKDDNKTTAELLVASDENEWYTPARYIEAAHRVLGAIDLDPASSDKANEVVGAARYYRAEDDGLSLPWEGAVWLNPPYGRLAGDFITRLLDEHRAGTVTSAVALVNAHCTDTIWFQGLWDHALCFTDHRIDFESAGREKHTTSTHGSVFAYLGDNITAFKRAFEQFGPIVRRA